MNRLKNILMELTIIAREMENRPYTIDECETHAEIMATLEHMKDTSLKQYTDRMETLNRLVATGCIKVNYKVPKD